jgi:hypothetical protein
MRRTGGSGGASGHLPRRSRGLLLGGVWLRFVTWWHTRALDRQLAAGADPMQSDELSLRVGQLGSSKSRRRLACALRGAVALAEQDAYPVGFAVPPIRRAAVRASSERLLEIAERLRGHEPVGVRGVAIALQLIDDRRGPLYRDTDRPLSVTAFEALVALDRGLRTISAGDRHAAP